MPLNNQEPHPVRERKLSNFFLKFLQRLGEKQPRQESKETDPHILRVTRTAPAGRGSIGRSRVQSHDHRERSALEASTEAAAASGRLPVDAQFWPASAAIRPFPPDASLRLLSDFRFGRHAPRRLRRGIQPPLLVAQAARQSSSISN